ncbi:MAG: hypothetical protein L6Q54_10710 [Leptospiraceae bacterium]|nr:hypothetical protein [Leptospiraceae bacterium]MCK6381699.1 hypothetical protein [Leptospiraceae bacterium]
MIIELYEVLLEIHASEVSAKKATMAIEKFIVDRTQQIRQNLVMEEFVPIEKEQIGIRSEIKFVGEKVDLRFSEIDKRMGMAIDQMKTGFVESDKKMNLVIDQMKTGFAESDKKINLVISEMNKRFQYMEKLQITMLGCLLGLVIKFLLF